MRFSKILSIIILTFVLLNSFGQKNAIVLFGKVKALKDSSALEDVYVSIRINDSITFGTKTNKEGNFVLLISKKALLKSNRIFFDHDLVAYNKKHPADTSCGYLDWFWGYLSAYRDIYSDSLRNITTKEVNVYLSRVEADIRFPNIVFDKNSSVPTINKKEDSLYQNPNKVIRHMFCIMRDNPTLIMQISGHSNYDETNAQKLSEERAKYAYQKLISYGINSKRIKAVGFGDTRLRYKKEKADTEEKAQTNRRVDFSIIAWDFKE